jgi:hypothetical protein
VRRQSMGKTWILLLFPLLAPACASDSIRIAPAEIRSFELSTARQIQPCYRSPKIIGAARTISTRLRVRYGRDGALIGPPELISQAGVTETNRLYAERMAEAARMAVIRCAPVRIPPALAAYPVNEIDLLFSPVFRT